MTDQLCCFGVAVEKKRSSCAVHLEPYENNMLVELVPEGTSVRMVVSIDRYPDEEWTSRAAAGFESQLTKLPAALAARRR